MFSGSKHLSGQEVIQNNIDTLLSGVTIFNDLTDDQYTNIHEPYFSASIGKHFRHILDHYFCFFAGLEAGHIDYDLRERDPSIETQREYTLSKIQEIIAQLNVLKQSYSQTPVEKSKTNLRVSLSSSTDTQQARQAESSLIRELIFLQGHTTHHYAIIGVQLKLMEYPVDDDFGMAASTLIYKEQTSCAQ